MSRARPDAKAMAQLKGKGKGRMARQDDDVDSGDPKTTTTLYLGGLPPALNSSGLLAHSSSLGPVRSAFVVTDKATSQSRGFGYVRYVLRGDAEKAVKEGLGEVDGYKISASWAKKRLAPEDRIKERPAKVEREDKPERKKSAFPHLPKDFDANRTVVLQGLPIPSTGEDEEAKGEEGGVTTKTLYKRVRKLGSIESVVYPAPAPPLGSASSSTAGANIVFETPTAAHLALSKLHGHVFKGHFLTAAIKSRTDALTRLGHAHGGRLIVRNLDFAVSEADLRWASASFGSVHSIDVPLATSDSGEIRGRGFAFVWFVAEADAEKAIEGMNGKRLWAGVAAEKVKEEKQGMKKSEKRKLAKGSGGEGEKGRVMAVDWALSKKDFAKAEAGDEVTAEGDAALADAEESDATESDGEEGEGSEADEESEEDDEDESDGTPSLHDESIGDEGEQASGDKNASTAPSEGVALFVRNLSFDVTEDQLYGMFRAFGPLRYARIVVDGRTKRSKGTGFVCFWKKEDAEAVLALSDRVEQEGAGKGPKAANGQPSVLQADPSSSLAARLSLQGRVLGVSRAVSKDEADKLREERDKDGKGKDRRNLYLMREGVIFANSYESRGLHPTDLETRQQSFDQRKALLRTNPSLYISKTRLAIRQMPLFVTDKMLKRLARHALAEWRKQVKRGARQELAGDEVADDTKKKDGEGKAGHVKQTKILRQADRVDGVSGKERSKGYGFLELVSHADALRVLRWANANPLVPGLLRQWHLEDLEQSLKQAEGQQDGGRAGESKEVRVKRINKKLAEVRDEVEADRVKAEKRAERMKWPKVEHKPPRMLIIEFAIENAQTVKRRKDKTERAREVGKRRAEEKAKLAEGVVEDAAPAGKKRKRGPDPASPVKKPKADDKSASNVRSLIGRKRREKARRA